MTKKNNLALRGDLLGPVETFYNGDYLDSRLEARWALFLDAFGLGFRYTKGVDNQGNGSMFYLTALDTWLVIKPALPELQDAARVENWVRNGSAKQAAILFGLCWYPWERDSYGGWLWFRNEAQECGGQRDVVWRQCVECGERCLASATEPCSDCGSRGSLHLDTPRLIRSYEAAAGVVFTHRNRV